VKYFFKPKSKLERFGLVVYNALVDNFSETFFVGGMVRDLLLDRPILDIDIATEAKPNEIINTLKENKITFDNSHISFGNIIAIKSRQKIEITTLRQDLESSSRYPKIKFIKSAKADSQRRDFTINALYLSLKKQKIFDFNKGLKDLEKKTVRFIGYPLKRIGQDPLRILRAIRFCLALNFKIEKNSWLAIKNNFSEINSLSQNRIFGEVKKIHTSRQKKLFLNILKDQKSLDKFLKKSYA